MENDVIICLRFQSVPRIADGVPGLSGRYEISYAWMDAPAVFGTNVLSIPQGCQSVDVS
jgi:hypothetical protein